VLSIWGGSLCRKKPYDSKDVAQKKLKDKADVLVVLTLDIARPAPKEKPATTTSSSKDFADKLKEASQHLSNGRMKVWELIPPIELLMSFSILSLSIPPRALHNI